MIFCMIIKMSAASYYFIFNSIQSNYRRNHIFIQAHHSLETDPVHFFTHLPKCIDIFYVPASPVHLL